MLFADPLVQRFSWTEARPYTVADARAYLEGIEAGRRAGRQLEFAVTEPGDEEAVLGCVSLFDVDAANADRRDGLLARRPRPRPRRRDARRAAADRLGVRDARASPRIQLTCAPDNLASQAGRRALRVHARGRAALAHGVQGRPPRHRGLRAGRRGSVARGGYQACSVPQCGQSTEVVTAALKA